MEHDPTSHDAPSLTVPVDQPLIGVLVEADGRQYVHYFAEDSSTAGASDATLQAALGVIGAWSDLDWDDFSTELDRIRHESIPTPPIEL